MYDRAIQEPDTKATFNGFIMLDEMSIQKDLQVQKKGGDWEILGAVDMGSLVNGLEYLSRKSDEITLATHYFPFIYSSFGQFRFPAAYYASNNANGHSIYLTLWPLLDALSEYDFKVHAVLLDGSSNNRQMTRIMTSPTSARILKYVVQDPYCPSHLVCIVQDIKHVLKKIRNSVFSSRLTTNAKRLLKLNDEYICWEHFEGAFEMSINSKTSIYYRLSRDHIYLNPQSKMRNHLAEQVLNADMLNLLSYYRCTLANPNSLNSTLEFLRHTAILVDIFLNTNSLITSEYDSRIGQVSKVLEFFHSWERQFESSKEKARHLITRETREDIDSCLYGFINVAQKCQVLGVALNPGYFNSDLIENWFCQMRTIRNGANSNPTLLQIGPAINTNILTGSVVSKKSNTSGVGFKSEPMQFATKAMCNVKKPLLKDLK